MVVCDIEQQQGLQFLLYDLSLVKLVQLNKNNAMVAARRAAMKNLRTLDPPKSDKSTRHKVKPVPNPS